MTARSTRAPRQNLNATIPARAYIPHQPNPVIGKPAPRALSVSQRMRAIQHSQQRIPMPPPAAPINRRPADHKRSSASRKNWLILGVLGVFGLAALTCMALTVGAFVILGGGVLPGVSVAGIDVGGMSQDEVASALSRQWTTITLRDNDRTWNIEHETLGINIDAQATAERAYDQGRGVGNFFAALFGGVDVAPVLSVDPATLRAGLESIVSQVERAPVNAGVQLVNGQVQATSPTNGRALDIESTIARLDNQFLSDGSLNLVMQTTYPAITDATPMLNAARSLLTNPLVVQVYDPYTGDIVDWALPPEAWASWLTASADPSQSTGLALTVQPAPVRDFLTAQSNVFDSSRYLKMDEAVADIQNAIAHSNTQPNVRVYHHDLQHVVQPGDTIVSVAWDYGVPYPWVQQANPGVDLLSAGQTITIPSVDNFLPYEPIPNKRIVVDLSEQRTRVYENGAIIWDWVTSTGIADSPTWTGVYQITSHVPNAYAGNWDLWMPNFMGVYNPIPNADFTNGFHGFPTRGGGQLLWENNLGTRVTYGCILLSNTNIQQLYNWAEEGVVVQIQP